MDKKRFYKNSVSGVIQLIITALLTFICIPLFLNKLGAEAYGIFSVVAVIGSLNVFANLGLNYALIKFLAEQGRGMESDYDIFVNLLIQLLIIVPLSFIAYQLKNTILLQLFNIPMKFYAQANTLYVCLLASNFLIFLGQTFTAILSAIQKIYLVNFIQMIYSFLYWGLIILVLLQGNGLSQVGYMILLAAIIWFFIILVVSIYQWGKMDIIGIRNNIKRVFIKQIEYGLKMYVSGIFSFLYEPITKILISHFIGLKEVGYLDLGFKVRNQVYGLLTRVLDPFFPFFSQEKNIEKLKYFINDVEQKFMLVVLPIIATIIICSESFLHLWLPIVNNEILYAVIMLTCAHLLFSLTVAPNFIYLASKNLAEKTIYIQATNVGVNFIVFFLTYKYLGFFGMILSLSAAILCSFLLGLYYQFKYQGTCIFKNFKHFLKYFILFGILLITGTVSSYFISNNWMRISVIPVIIFMVAISAIKYLKFFNNEDIYRYINSNSKLGSFMVSILVYRRAF